MSATAQQPVAVDSPAGRSYRNGRSSDPGTRAQQSLRSRARAFGLLTLCCLFLAPARPVAQVATASVIEAAAGGVSTEIVSRKPRAALHRYTAGSEFEKSYFDERTYQEARTQDQFLVEDIEYRSATFIVHGILVTPRHAPLTPLPLIVFNRGGSGNFGRLEDIDVVDFLLWAKMGFVIAASDYRYVGEQGPKDEFGGAELQDVLNLLNLARALPGVAPGRAYMIGQSRGAMMTLMAVRAGAPVQAVAVVGGVYDLEKLGHDRPEFLDGNENFLGWRKNWPDFATRAAEHFRARSAIYWPEDIKVPVLILHARDDRLVHATQALELATALQGAGREYSLHIFNHDRHALPLHRSERNRLIGEWFARPKED